jgi:hypothetical protein
VSIINASNWNETIYPPGKRRLLLRDMGNPHVCLLDLGNPAANWCAPGNGPFARSVQLIGNNQVLAGRGDGYEVLDLTTGANVKTVQTFANTQSAYRRANGETMLARSGTLLTFLDANDVESHHISYPGYGFVRAARPTRHGTFLVPSDNTLFEGTPTGRVLWTTNIIGWDHIYAATLLANGDALVSTGLGASLDVVDKTTHLVTRRLGTKQMPMAQTFLPHEFQGFEILPNGNVIVANFEGFGAANGAVGIQVIEFSPAGDVVWFYKQDPTIFSSIGDLLVLDGKDPRYLHVQETSADGTWQPVIPP